MIPDIDLFGSNIVHISCTCVRCNENCQRDYISIEEFEDLDGCYCPYIDDWTEWKIDTALDIEDNEVELPEEDP